MPKPCFISRTRRVAALAVVLCANVWIVPTALAGADLTEKSLTSFEQGPFNQKPSDFDIKPYIMNNVPDRMSNVPDRHVLMAENKASEDKAISMKAPANPSGAMNMVLATYVKAPDAAGVARFDYAALKASSADQDVLSSYITSLEARDPSVMAENVAIAYWANLYNAVTVKVVIDNYPVKSIKAIKSGAFTPGPWKRDLVTVNGKKMSLDDIEHKTLRKTYPSPLVHYMVNCASIGCPNLKGRTWEEDTLKADREAAARAFINSPRGARVTPKGLVVSSIYDWFQEDFGGSKAGVLEHLSLYATGDLKEALNNDIKIKGFDYDWSLNRD